MSAIDTSYATQLDSLGDIDDPLYLGTVTNIYKGYYQAKLTADEVGDGVDVVINPQFVHNGVRTLARLGSWLGKFYLRHKALIDPFLDAALTAAFTTIGNRADEIKNLNNRGPT